MSRVPCSDDNKTPDIKKKKRKKKETTKERKVLLLVRFTLS